MGWCRGGEDEDRDTECFQQFLCCPACKQEYDISLILPCSHTMCRSCVAAGEGARPRHGPRQPTCSVLCPCCRHPVELPCWTWSSATSCLPKHPTMTSNNINGDKGVRGGSSEDQPQQVRYLEGNSDISVSHSVGWVTCTLPFALWGLGNCAVHLTLIWVRV